jgi:hypothetical protein
MRDAALAPGRPANWIYYPAGRAESILGREL